MDLAKFGFSERENKVYLALLELGRTTVGPIAAQTRIQHTKVYQTLNKLIDKGLVSFVLIGKVKHFSASDPKNILIMLKEKEREFSEILPQLEQKKQFSQKPQLATIYEGYKAIKSMYDGIIEQMDKDSYYYVFAFRDEYKTTPLAARFIRNIHEKLAEKKIDDRLIGHTTMATEVKNTFKGNKRIKVKYTKSSFPAGLLVTGDEVINFTWGERPTAVVIKSEQIAKQYKTFFLEMWKTTI